VQTDRVLTVEEAFLTSPRWALRGGAGPGADDHGLLIRRGVDPLIKAAGRSMEEMLSLTERAAWTVPPQLWLRPLGLRSLALGR
jgi:hypothetical protein